MKFVTTLGFITCFLFTSQSAQALSLIDKLGEVEWKDGTKRFELNSVFGSNSGGKTRSGDLGLVATVEREFPLYKKLSVGLRAMPLYLYEEKHSDGHTIWGLGGGVSLRHYWKKSHKKWFSEVTETLVIHSEKFRGNSTKFNFMTEFGLGYQFENEWFVIGKWRHLSNASIGRKNSGVNGVGLGFGFRF